MRTICLLLALFVAIAAGKVYYKETFDASWEQRWVQSEKKDDYGKFKLSHGDAYGDKDINLGIQTSQDARFYALSGKIDPSFTNKDKPLVLTFSVKHEQGIDCGGGYIKLLPEGMTQKNFNGDDEYFIMFGPDICGATKKIHLIFGYKGKNLLWKKEPRCESDSLTHVYTLILSPNNTYEVHVDDEKRESGKLEEDWEFLKPKMIADPKDKKPSDWVDEAEIDDPADKKPADWDTEPETIADPEAKQPEDWDEGEDGKWEAPQIPNPKHKGAWKAKRIPNPAYKGEWKAKQIENPEYEQDDELYLARKPLAFVGFDLWQVKSGTIFDSIMVTDELKEANEFIQATWGKTKDAEKKMHEKAEEAKRAKEEEERKANEKKDAKEDKEEDDKEEDDKGEAKEDEL
jgi:calreticulin